MSNHHIHRGFSLIELMIAVLVLGIIAAIAYPNYTSYVFDSRRTDGHASLMDAAQRLERCYSSTLAYDESSGGACDNVTGDFPLDSPEDHYSVSLSNLAATTYTLTATPQGAQSSDECGNLTLDHTGQRGIDDADGGLTADDCW